MSRSEGRDSSSLLRSVAVLVAGAGAAQVISLLTLPVVTRIYGPADFELLAMFVSVLGVALPIACLRFDLLIAVVDDGKEAARLLALSCFAATCVGVIAALFGGGLFFIVGVSRWSEAVVYAALLFIGVAFGGISSALTFWNSRHREYRKTSRARIGQAMAAASVQIGGGLFGLKPAGLLLGAAIASGGAAFLMNWRSAISAVSQAGFNDILRAARGHWRYTKYSVPESLLNNGAIQVPMLILATAGTGSVAGYALLAYRVLQIPLGVVGTSISQYYTAEARTRRDRDELAPFTARLICLLALLGTGPLTFFSIVAGDVFPLVFGNEWARAGELVSWMGFWSVAQLLASPFGSLAHTISRPRWALGIHAIGFAVRVGPLSALVMVAPKYLVGTLIATASIFYAVYLCCVLRMAGVDLRQLRQIGLAMTSSAAIGALLGLVAKLALGDLDVAG